MAQWSLSSSSHTTVPRGFRPRRRSSSMTAPSRRSATFAARPGREGLRGTWKRVVEPPRALWVSLKRSGGRDWWASPRLAAWLRPRSSVTAGLGDGRRGGNVSGLVSGSAWHPARQAGRVAGCFLRVRRWCVAAMGWPLVVVSWSPAFGQPWAGSVWGCLNAVERRLNTTREAVVAALIADMSLAGLARPTRS